MNYRITGLQRESFAPLFAMQDAQLAEHGALRVLAAADKGWPSQISREDAKAGESLLMINQVSHDAATPYRSSYAIYLREEAFIPAEYVGQNPSVVQGRLIALRAFEAEGILRNAALALPGQVEAHFWELLAADEIAFIHAHHAAHGCFTATVERA